MAKCAWIIKFIIWRFAWRWLGDSECLHSPTRISLCPPNNGENECAQKIWFRCGVVCRRKPSVRAFLLLKCSPANKGISFAPVIEWLRYSSSCYLLCHPLLFFCFSKDLLLLIPSDGERNISDEKNIKLFWSTYIYRTVVGPGVEENIFTDQQVFIFSLRIKRENEEEGKRFFILFHFLLEMLSWFVIRRLSIESGTGNGSFW